ncbi:hypothetical protein M9H77_31429 [Catharanthus roseus]|uniref:Uncharacterized protein n=1 Tax=Catharanthus roseus TaxID=4058 RepID=A0ACC0A2S1_CATRO|nr:hypothetical protein M9H77_31429 [Catharanthus roseus]
MRYLWTIPIDISKDGIHILVEFEPIEQQNIPITHDMNTTSLPEHITAVTQVVFDEPSMLYSAVNNDDDEVDGSDGDEVVSNIGSGSPIDDLLESGTIRLLDWNNSMTDIQLGMRFVDKVQAVSAVRKHSISVGHEYQVLKSKIDHGPQDVTIIVTIITVHGTSV